MRSGAGQQRRNGYLVVTGVEPRGAMMRAGVEFGARRLVVYGPGWRQVAAEVAIEWDGARAIDVRAQLDFEAHELVLAGAGKRLVAPLPEAWRELRAWGYGASNAETVFGPLRIE